MSRQYHTREFIQERIIYVRYAGFEPTEEEFDVYLDDLYENYQQKERFVIILDGTDSKYLPSSLRIKQGRWLAEHKQLVIDNCISQVFVIPNPVVKMILQGIFLVQKPLVSYFIFTKKDDAIKKAQELLAAEIASS